MSGDDRVEPHGIYLWRVLIGWRFYVATEVGTTVVMWRLTQRAALRRANEIVRDY